MMKYSFLRNSQGVALLAALFVLMVLTILAVGLLVNVSDEMSMSKSTQNAENALKVAEAGLQIARTTFFDPIVALQAGDTRQISSIDGFYMGGYFLAQLESGFRGNEKWKQWRYDSGVSGHNSASEVSTPLFQVWLTGAQGVNGSWRNNTWSGYYVENIFGIIARGTYFTVEDNTGGTMVRAHDEYTGAQQVKKDNPDFIDDNFYWVGDKVLTGADPNIGTTAYAVEISPMASFSNYTLPAGLADPVLSQQTLYFTYAGSSTSPGAADTESTVRLRASNAMCNYGTGANEQLDPLWEFDTGLHGTGTAPAFFDPTPQTPGDEIIYFAVISRGRAGRNSALDLQAANINTFRSYPSQVSQDSEQIYLFAVVDTTIPNPINTICNTPGTYRLKWAHPFPDPDVIDWTDYPTEHATGTYGYNPPFVSRPEDITPLPPEDDLLMDYRDGPYADNQWNQTRGNVAGIMSADPPVSPPVVKALYRRADGTLTEKRDEAADPFDPVIDIYLMFTAVTRVTYTTNGNPYFGDNIWGYNGRGWGPAGYRKPNRTQTRIVALRDRLARNNNNWNWNAAKTRYPTLKWSYAVPPWDPDQTFATPDARPGFGYGEYNWDTWFEQQIAPMIHTTPWNQDGAEWANVVAGGQRIGGQEEIYNVLYAYYKCVGFFTGGANVNDTSNGRRGPTIAEGSPVNFSGSTWADSHVMVMAVRDTWDDYMRGDRTNIIGQNLDRLKLTLTNPYEPYWTHVDASGAGGAGGTALPTDQQSLITYNATANAPYRTSANKVGFPRPYAWWEDLWRRNVRNTAIASRSLNGQGWQGVNGTDSSVDLDVEGEVATLCEDCLFRDGLMIISINHDLSTPGMTDREDLRIHAINATSGVHEWEYHLPASLVGDDANTTPSIANNQVFVAYQRFGSKTIQANRQARLLVLNANDGGYLWDMLISRDSDAIILPPTIANGAVYVGTYDFNWTYGDSNKGDDQIRLFAMSPVLRLVSTGIYPFNAPGADAPLGYRHYTGNNFKNITLLDHDDIFKNPSGQVRSVWKRKLQVWVTGSDSKWEEVREVLEQ